MNVNVTQICDTVDNTEHICTQWTYTGSIQDIQISIPMLEAMGLIILWIVVCISIVSLIKKFT